MSHCCCGKEDLVGRDAPLKRARFGMETFIPAEAESGYVWDVLPYTEKRTQYDYQIPGLSDQDVT